MEKKEMTSLDFRFLVRELKEKLTNGVIRKIYQYGRKEFLFEIFVSGKGEFWLYADGEKMFLTRRKKPSPQEPPSFCMLLRKHLLGKRIKYIKQHDFDRVVEFEIDGYILIFEMVHPGNLILCDSSYQIIMPLEIQRWRHREVKPKIPYRHPPMIENPFEMDLDDLLRKIKKNPEKKIVALLAANLSFGSIYGNEICEVAGINPDKPCEEISLEEASRIHRVIEVLKEIPLKPVLYSEGAFPFPLKVVNGVPKEMESFSEALDEYYSEKEEERVVEEVKKEVQERTEKIQRIQEAHEKAMEKWERIEKDSRDSAERIYNYYDIVAGVLGGLRKARDMGMTWEEIKKKLSEEATPEAESIREIREGDGIVVLNLGGKDVEIEIGKTVEENAEKYYEEAKWAKRKLEGVKQAEKELEEKAKEVPKEIPKPQVWVKEKPKRRKWYEKFRWFVSSDGFLVVAGKDAQTNEILIKKYTNPEDLVFHADIPGAAFVVVKSEGKEIPEETKKEAAEFAAAYSKAWSKGLGTVDVYAVPGDKVVKGGINLPKGTFLIQGERQWFREQEIKLSIGVKIERETKESKVVAGPVMVVRRNSDYFVTIKPGFKQAVELSREIKNKILIKAKPEDKFFIESIPLDEFQRFIPSGMGEIVEYGV